MSQKNKIQSFIIDDNDSMEMKETEFVEDLKTQYHTGLSDAEIEKNANNRLLKNLFGPTAVNFKKMELNNETKIEKIQEFSGGFADVTLLKFRKNGKLFIVKKNRKVGPAKDTVESDTINEIKLMMKVKSDYVIRCYGYSEDEEGKGGVSIVMEYGGDQLDVFLQQIEGKKETDKLREILEDLLVQSAVGISDIHDKGIMHRGYGV